MLKLLKKKKANEFPETNDKAVQCDNNDPLIRILILEKLPKYSNPFDENFNNFLQQLHLTMEALKINEKEKVSFLFACLQGPASDKVKQCRPNIHKTSTWEDATTTLKMIFNPLQTNGNIQTLRQLKQQRDQDFNSYATIVQQMVNNIFLNQLGYTDSCREIETIRYSIRGAKKELKHQLKGTKHISIADLILKAKALESNMTEQ